MDASLRSRLTAVSRARGPAAASAPRPEPGAPPLAGEAETGAPTAGSGRLRPRGRIPPLEKILPGREIRSGSGVCWLHERPLHQWSGADPGLLEQLEHRLTVEPPADMADDPGLVALRSAGIASGFFLDLETTGLAGMPVFLAGVLAAGVEGFQFRLYLARDYREEAPLLEALAAEFEARPTVITYNGKSYDVPYLRERAARLRVGLPAVRSHLDLLHAARRRWAGRLPDCRLTTLEWHLCGRRRVGDIPGSEIPAAYHRWVRDGDPRPLLPVFRHNMVDLYTLAEITDRVIREPWPGA